MADRFRILITGGGTTTAVSALKGLRMAQDPSLQVVMGDMTSECAGALLGDEFTLLPSASAPDFEALVIRLCLERHINMVIPIIDHEFAGWSKVRPILADQGVQVVVSSLPALQKCQEKD